MGRLVQGPSPGLDQNPVRVQPSPVDAEPHFTLERTENPVGSTRSRRVRLGSEQLPPARAISHAGRQTRPNSRPERRRPDHRHQSWPAAAVALRTDHDLHVRPAQSIAAIPARQAGRRSDLSDTDGTSTHGRPAHPVHQGPRRLDPPDCRGRASRKGAQRTRVPFLRHHDQGLLRTRGQPSRTPRGNDSNFCEEATQSDPLWLDPKKVHLSTALERPVDSKGREIPRGTRTRPGAVLCGNSGCPATPTACTDINVTAGIRPVYHVKAINAAGAGPQSNYFLVEP